MAASIRSCGEYSMGVTTMADCEPVPLEEDEVGCTTDVELWPGVALPTGVVVIGSVGNSAPATGREAEEEGGVVDALVFLGSFMDLFLNKGVMSSALSDDEDRVGFRIDVEHATQQPGQLVFRIGRHHRVVGWHANAGG